MQFKIAIILFFYVLILTANTQQTLNQTHQHDHIAIGYQSEQESFFSTSIFIGIIVLLSFNLLVFLIVLVVIIFFRRAYKVEININRQVFGMRYPLLTFETTSHCLVEGQKFESTECYELGEVIRNLPAFIYGRQIEAETSHMDYLTIKQCSRCGGMTPTLQIFKYGQLRQFWSTVFMILISPCFLALTIRMLTTNNILWQKFFCTQCGYEKPSHAD